MVDALRDIILAATGIAVLIVMNRASVRKTRIPARVRPFLLVGFALLLVGRVLEMTGEPSLVGVTMWRVLLQEVVGFLVGFLVLAVGLIRWMPEVTGGQRAKRRSSSRPNAGDAPARRVLAPRVGDHSAHELLNSVLKSSLSGVMVAKAVRDQADEIVDLQCVLMNEAAEQILGRSAANLVGRNVLQEFPCIRAENLLGNMVSVIETGLPFRNERQFSHARDPRWYQFVAVKLGDGIAVTFSDVSDRKRAEEQLRHAAHHDTLTGLPNRALFTERLAQAINRARRFPDYKFAVLFLDFDRFKVINDSLGHEAGDQLLTGIAERLRDNLRSIDTSSRMGDGHLPARLGGDEFVVLLDSIQVTRDAVRVAERLQRELSRPHVLGGHEVVSTASIGIVVSDLGYDSADDILRDADTAMYRAKTTGKARHVVFDENMHQEAVQRLELESALRDAVEKMAFHLDFEPIVTLETGAVSAFEALIRWPRGDKGVVPPAEFIGVAEELGILVPIGNWVLRQACVHLRAWQQLAPEFADLAVDVNLSRQQLQHPDLVATVKRVIDDTGVAPRCLRLEITEAMIMSDVAGCSATLRELQELGVKIVIDDFGTGQSSLTCLHQFPINIIKIDGDFIKGAKKRRDYGAIVHAVVELGHNLGMQVVAEGVENADQIALLQALDCDFGQGHHFSRPIDASAVESLLTRHTHFGIAA